MPDVRNEPWEHREFTLAHRSEEECDYGCGHKGPRWFTLWCYNREAEKRFGKDGAPDAPDQCPECVKVELLKVSVHCPHRHRLYIPGTFTSLDHLYYHPPQVVKESVFPS